MSHNIFDVLSGDFQVSARIKHIRVCLQSLTNACCKRKSQIGINVDLADRGSCRLTKLIFRNTDGVFQRSAVLIDDLDVFLRNGRRSVQNNREARDSLDDLIEDVETKLRFRSRFKFVSTVGSTDRDREGVNTCSAPSSL